MMTHSYEQLLAIAARCHGLVGLQILYPQLDLSPATQAAAALVECAHEIEGLNMALENVGL